MSSIMTNTAAMTALKSLQATNSAMETTQDRISTGLRVSEAADNAAYWSIATTMRSDNSALSTVQDALGLGAAKVDVAYTGINSAKEVVDEIKVKLVAAREPGVDKAKIQAEIDQLQFQLTGAAESAGFFGTNWLSVNSDAATYEATAEIVSSFNRAADGSVSVGTIGIDVSTVALFDAGATSDGLLEGGLGAVGTSAAFTWTQGSFADGDSIQLTVTVDGTAQAVDITVADAANFSLDELVAGINADVTGAVASASAGGELVLTATSGTTGTASTIELGGFAVTQADATTAATIGFTTIAQATGATTGGGIMDIQITTATSAEVDAWISRVDAMAESLTQAAADLGSSKNRVDLQSNFVSSLMDAIDRGIGQLVDADMTEESTRLQALQTQQQLGIQALSIANQNAQNILALFQ